MTPSPNFSIWLMPTGKINDELSKMIFQLSRQFMTPVFPPHMTLLGQLTGEEKELSSQTQHLASHICPFQVNLTTVDYLDAYFRCLFLRVEETIDLLTTHQEARRIFRRESDPKFLPHLSLIYGYFENRTKEQIIASIGRDFNQWFDVSQIHLFSTTGEPKDWYRVQAYDLQGRHK